MRSSAAAVGNRDVEAGQSAPPESSCWGWWGSTLGSAFSTVTSIMGIGCSSPSSPQANPPPPEASSSSCFSTVWKYALAAVFSTGKLAGATGLAPFGWGNLQKYFNETYQHFRGVSPDSWVGSVFTWANYIGQAGAFGFNLFARVPSIFDKVFKKPEAENNNQQEESIKINLARKAANLTFYLAAIGQMMLLYEGSLKLVNPQDEAPGNLLDVILWHSAAIFSGLINGYSYRSYNIPQLNKEINELLHAEYVDLHNEPDSPQKRDKKVMIATCLVVFATVLSTTGAIYYAVDQAFDHLPNDINKLPGYDLPLVPEELQKVIAGILASSNFILQFFQFEPKVYQFFRKLFTESKKQEPEEDKSKKQEPPLSAWEKIYTSIGYSAAFLDFFNTWSNNFVGVIRSSQALFGADPNNKYLMSASGVFSFLFAGMNFAFGNKAVVDNRKIVAKAVKTHGLFRCCKQPHHQDGSSEPLLQGEPRVVYGVR